MKKQHTTGRRWSRQRWAKRCRKRRDVVGGVMPYSVERIGTTTEGVRRDGMREGLDWVKISMMSHTSRDGGMMKKIKGTKRKKIKKGKKKRKEKVEGQYSFFSLF